VSDLTLLPSTWIQAKLQDLVDVHYGKALPAKDRVKTGNTPVVGSSGIVGYHDTALIEGSSIVVGRKGSAGAIHLVSESCWPIDTAYFIQPPGSLEIRWCAYFLKTLDLGQFDKSTAIPSLSRDDLYQVQIPIAPSAEQMRILERLEELLSELDTGVSELEAAQIKLDQYRQSLLKAAVEGALTAVWRQTNLVKESGLELLGRILVERRVRWEANQLEQFAEKGRKPPKNWQEKYPEPVHPDTADLPELPKGWVWASLDMIGEIASGVAKGTKHKPGVAVREVPYLRVANVQRGYLDLSEVKTIVAAEKKIKDLVLQNGDVLFNEGGDRDKLGRGWVWRNEVDNCIHQNHVFRMRPLLPETIPELVSHHGNTFGRTWFQNAGKQTTNLASINLTMLRMFPVPVAPAAEQNEILAQVQVQLDNLAQQANAIELALKQSEAQRKNILKAAFSGLLVPQNPNDEPAGALLERIRTERMAQAKQPKSRQSRPKKETSTVAEKLIEVLTNDGDWMEAREAFRRCGVTDGTQTDRIEVLYAELRELDQAGKLLVEAITDGEGRKLHDRIKLVAR